jgi:hypothetical protein
LVIIIVAIIEKSLPFLYFSVLSFLSAQFSFFILSSFASPFSFLVIVFVDNTQKNMFESLQQTDRPNLLSRGYDSAKIRGTESNNSSKKRSWLRGSHA